jgi:hypothetical protein
MKSASELHADIQKVAEKVVERSGLLPSIKSTLDSAYSGGDPKTLRAGEDAAGTDTKRILSAYSVFLPKASEDVVERPISGDTSVDGALRSLPAGSRSTGGAFLLPCFVRPETVATAIISGSANQVRGIRVFWPIGCTITKVMIEVVGATASALAAVGIYSSDGGTKWLDSGAIDCGSNGIKSVTLGTPVDVPMGFCCFVATCNDTTTTFRSAVMVSTVTNLENEGTVQRFNAANASAAGVLPSSLGTLTGASFSNLPFSKMQG